MDLVKAERLSVKYKYSIFVFHALKYLRVGLLILSVAKTASYTLHCINDHHYTWRRAAGRLTKNEHIYTSTKRYNIQQTLYTKISGLKDTFWNIWCKNSPGQSEDQQIKVL